MTPHAALDDLIRNPLGGELPARTSGGGQASGLATPPPDLTQAWTRTMTKAFAVVARLHDASSPYRARARSQGGEP